MRTEQRMDQDFDYHMNTGELPEYYGNGGQNNEGCIWLLGICVFIVVCIWMCTSSSNKKETGNNVPSQSVEQPTYTPPLAPSYVAPDTVATSTNLQTNQPSEEEKSPEVQPYVPTKKIKLSAAYEEGYERGYEDGEEDAYAHSGWQTSFDDDCHYKGKKKADYEEGYEDGYEAGYEAGYDDNMSDYDD